MTVTLHNYFSKHFIKVTETLEIYIQLPENIFKKYIQLCF